MGNVVLEDDVPEPFEIVRVSSESPHSVEGQRVRISIGALDKGPAGLATIDVALPENLSPGVSIRNVARLAAEDQTIAEAADLVVVRSAQAGRIACALRAQVYARPGTPLRYAVRYKNGTGNNTLTVSLPEVGFAPSGFVPVPSLTAANVLEYAQLARTAGMVRVDGNVAPDVADGTVLYAWAAIKDDAGNANICEHRSEVRTKERLALFLKGPAKWRRSSTYTAVARYSGALPNNELTVVLPDGVEVIATQPAATRQEGNVLKFQFLQVPAGLVKLKLRATALLNPGGQVVLYATVTDESGFVATSTTTATLLP
ncbi:MAG: hypothetical protein KatS3mg077_1949 [Candidatus Binatia bacterium]|nr:MAG: hypothetical protein KatS3mg077_1949 [Candidatus Binatia bacterium]